jgi:hypothetical protein
LKKKIEGKKAQEESKNAASSGDEESGKSSDSEVRAEI